MSPETWKCALGRGLAYLGNYNWKRAFDFNYKWNIHSWKVKGVGGLLNVHDDSFSWKWQLRENCGEVSCAWGNWVFHWFMHSKQIYEPRETFKIEPTKPWGNRPNHFSLIIHSGSHGFGPWVTKIILGFYWIFNGFLHTSWFSYVLAKVLFSRLQKDTSRS